LGGVRYKLEARKLQKKKNLGEGSQAKKKAASSSIREHKKDSTKDSLRERRGGKGLIKEMERGMGIQRSKPAT